MIGAFGLANERWLSRRDHADALMPLLEEAFGSRPAAAWVEVLTANDIPAALIQTLQEFMRDPAVQHHRMTVTYDHPELGRHLEAIDEYNKLV